MAQESKILTHGAVIEIIVTSRVPNGATSADDVVLRRIQEFIDDGYVLDKNAQREVTIRQHNGSPSR